jgi:hypothetical protein
LQKKYDSFDSQRDFLFSEALSAKRSGGSVSESPAKSSKPSKPSSTSSRTHDFDSVLDEDDAKNSHDSFDHQIQMHQVEILPIFLISHILWIA